MEVPVLTNGELVTIAALGVVASVIALCIYDDRLPQGAAIEIGSRAVTIIEENAVGLTPTTWEPARKAVMEHIGKVRSRKELYAQLRIALQTLDDNQHSFALTQRDWRSYVQAAEGKTDESLSKSGALAEVQPLDEVSGIIEIRVPPFMAVAPDMQWLYAERLASAVTATVELPISPSRLCGVIVDLRETGGGNSIPASWVLGRALLGHSNVRYRDRSGLEVLLDQDAVRRGLNVRDLSTSLDQVHKRLQGLPLAVLVGPHTVSASEAIAAMLWSSPAAVLVGQRTAGMTTANNIFELPDGGVLALAVYRFVDPQGKAVKGPLVPDVLVDDLKDARSAATAHIRSRGVCRAS